MMRKIILFAVLALAAATYDEYCTIGEEAVEKILRLYDESNDDFYILGMRSLCYDHYEYCNFWVSSRCYTTCPGLYLAREYYCSRQPDICYELQRQWISRGCVMS